MLINQNPYLLFIGGVNGKGSEMIHFNLIFALHSLDSDLLDCPGLLIYLLDIMCIPARFLYS